LRVVEQGRDIRRYDVGPTQAHEDTDNVGRHTIYTGGRYDSHLLVPTIPTP
jgi:predicted acyl esterase